MDTFDTYIFIQQSDFIQSDFSLLFISLSVYLMYNNVFISLSSYRWRINNTILLMYSSCCSYLHSLATKFGRLTYWNLQFKMHTVIVYAVTLITLFFVFIINSNSICTYVIVSVVGNLNRVFKTNTHWQACYE